MRNWDGDAPGSSGTTAAANGRGAHAAPSAMPDDLRDQLERSLGADYDIERELGGGGMSRVFVARDERLAREVVVKVLPADASAALSNDRFKREIALAARLQHPHIVPVLSSGEVAGLPYYIMPFVEGESLRDRLTREGELSVADTVTILREVARALAYAHERGIVHRDIKPDNVMLSGGAAMVTDFGVAKAIAASGGDRPERAESARDLALSKLTQLGVALGTPAYMAPEQAAADPSVDARADLYSFGCMAYEMLTGLPPFAGRPASATLAAHVNETPEPVARRRPRVPPALAALVMQCLEKRPADRPKNATEVLRALDAVAVTPHETASVAAMPAVLRSGSLLRASVMRWTPWVLLVAASIIAAVAIRRTRIDERRPSSPPVRFMLAPPTGWRIGSGGPEPVAIAPNGRTIAFVASSGVLTRLWVRTVDQFRPTSLDGTDGAQMPFFSPDGQWIAFFTADKLRKIRASGGQAVDVADLPGPAAGGAWTKGGEIIAGFQGGVMKAGVAQGLMKVSAAGGTFRALTRPATATEFHVGPRVFPDGETVLFQRIDPAHRSSTLALASAASGDFTSLQLRASRGVGALDGRIAWIGTDGTLMVAPVDLTARRVSGEAVPLVESISSGASLAASGTLVYLTGSSRSTLVALDPRTGTSRTILGEARTYDSPRISPDGKRVALSVGTPGTSSDVWIGDLASGTLTRLTSDGHSDQPEWAGATSVLFRRQIDDKPPELWSQSIDGAAAPTRVLTMTKGGFSDASISAERRTLVYRASDLDARSARDLFTSSIEAGVASAPRALIADRFRKVAPRISPDGKWVTYASQESGRSEVYVRSASGAGGVVQLSLDGGGEPMWSNDGRRVFYRAGNSLIVAAVVTSPAFGIVSRQTLASDWVARRGVRANWDVVGEGRELIALKPEEGDEQIAVVIDWGTEVRARVPSGSAER